MSWFKLFLWPFSLLYGLVMLIRNKLFDWKILPSKRFGVAVIGVGNLSTGGTGKTPHTEYLVNMLHKKRNVAVLSRGYKRDTKGFRSVSATSTAAEVGDEPAQVKRKFPGVLVVVHERRKKGIEKIIKDYPEVDTIILDDAFQHRYVQPGLKLLLTDYYKPFFDNHVLPMGNLREFKSGARRADAMIITKTPDVFSPLEKRFFEHRLQPYRKTSIFFSSLKYAPPLPVWPLTIQPDKRGFKTIFMLTGIENPDAFQQYLHARCEELRSYRFRDHHQFSSNDLCSVRDDFNACISRSKAVITTEKDAMRLQSGQAKDILQGIPVYYIPIKVVFHKTGKTTFDAFILEYLQKEKSNWFGLG